jgi:large subunit ribosomal protein L15
VKPPVKAVHPPREIKAARVGQATSVRWRTRVFNNIHRVSYKVFNLGQIDQLVEKYDIKEFSLENLYENGLIARTDLVKILANGELRSKLSFKVNAASDKAKQAIEEAGGALEILK